MYGVFIEQGAKDWQIFQQAGEKVTVHLSGSWIVPQAAIEVGVKWARPMIRLINEKDNYQILPWTDTDSKETDTCHGQWEYDLSIPEGGLYRIETGLDTESTDPKYHWIFRGDIRMHIGAGDIFVIAGQSNAAGYGRDFATDEPDMSVHVYRNRRSWEIASHPLNDSTDASDDPNAEMGIAGISPYLSFGKRYSEMSNRPVGLISTAKGGQPISRWDRRTDGTLFSNMLEKIRECGGRVAGILWYQGCTDACPDCADNYFEAFKYMVNDLREELGCVVPFFTFQLNRELHAESAAGWGKIREAQRQAAIQIPETYIMSTTNCPISDGIHNNAHSNILLGERLAKQCAGELCGRQKFEPPRLGHMELYVEDNKYILSVEFTNMTGGFFIYGEEKEYSGFFIEDDKGSVPVHSIKVSNNDRHYLLLELGRQPEDSTRISFLADNNPTLYPPVDDVTYLPPVSFYEVLL